MKFHRIDLSSFVGALLLVAACGGGGPAAAPAASDIPRRWVSIVPAGTELLFALGLGDSVVAVSDFCAHPPEVRLRPRVGSLAGIDLDRLALLEADVLVFHPSQRDQAAKARALGMQPIELPAGGIGDLFAAARLLGRSSGAPAAGEELARALETALAPRPPPASRPRALLVTARSPGAFHGIHAAGPGSYLHDLLERAGAVNVLAAQPIQSVRLEAVDIAALKPDLVIELLGVDALALERDPSRAAAEWRRLGALRAAVVVGDTALVPGPRLPGFFAELCAIIGAATPPPAR